LILTPSHAIAVVLEEEEGKEKKKKKKLYLPSKITQYKYIHRGTVEGCQRRQTPSMLASLYNNDSKQFHHKNKTLSGSLRKDGNRRKPFFDQKNICTPYDSFPYVNVIYTCMREKTCVQVSHN